MSGATISGITAELIDRKLVFEKETGTSRGGRRPILLALDPKGGYVIGLKLSEDHITGVLTDLKATVIASHTNGLKGRSVETVMDAVEDVVSALLTKSGLKHKQLLGVGVGLAGIIDTDSRRLRHSPIFGWRNVPLSDLLQERLNVSVYLDNDVNTLTLAEQWFGVGQGVNNFLVVTIGRGVGLGMVINGQIYQGAHGGAGELGHTVIDPMGPLCKCGKTGCLETYLADPALVSMGAASFKDVITVDDLLALAHEGQQAAIDVYSGAGDALAKGIANLINVLSPELIIISGEGVRAGDLLFKPMNNALKKYVMPGLSEDTQIQIDSWDDDAWARGAASLVLGELYVSPLVREAVA
ncbi:MAG: ROK family protein [Anaerolineales bacterium]